MFLEPGAATPFAVDKSMIARLIAFKWDRKIDLSALLATVAPMAIQRKQELLKWNVIECEAISK